MPKQPKQEFYAFGREMIRARDLDAAICVLWEAQLDTDLLYRWLLARWCFCHSGTASWICQIPKLYWQRMQEAASSSNYPRGGDRRHFRGKAAYNSVQFLMSKGIDGLFKPLLKGGSVLQVTSYVKQWVGFGPWAAFDVADTIELLGIANVDCSLLYQCMYRSPEEAATLVWKLEGRPKLGETQRVQWALSRILAELGDLKSPPRLHRNINYQEAETVLCRWKSFLSGSYYIGEDIQHCRDELLAFARCPLAQRLFAAGRKTGLF